MLAGLVSNWGHLLNAVPSPITAVAALQPPGQAPGTGAQGTLLGQVSRAVRPGGFAGSGSYTLEALECSLEGQGGLLTGALQPHLLFEFWLLFGEAVFRVVGPTEVPKVLEVGWVLAEAANKARGTQGLGDHGPQTHGGGERQRGPGL